MNREAYLNQFHKRQARVAYLRDEKRMSFAEIGAKLRPPVTRQAAAKMYKRR